MKNSVMLRILAAFTAGLLAAPAVAGDRTQPAEDIQAANKRLGRGINIGNALEAMYEGQWGVTLKADYFRAIKEAGFDTIRLPVNWSAHAQDSAPYTIDRKFAERVSWAIDQAVAKKLNIIVNVHHYGAMDSNPDKHLPRLVGLWEQIAEQFKDRPVGLYFELLNEPHDKLIDNKWNAAIPKVLEAVRKTNPTRPVIIGPGQWNAIWALDKLRLPKDDQHLIVTVHFYDPFEFTHQGASWVKGADKWKGRHWTGTPAEKSAIQKQFEKVAVWAKKHHRPIFLGEFGAYQDADLASRARWTRFVAREAEKLGFSWAYWEFCAGFGAYDAEARTWRDPLKAALLGQ